MVEKLKNYNKIFFIGIGGISMSGLALLARHFGTTVLGSDLQNNDQVKKLKKQGIRVFGKHRANNIKNCDLVVYSGAISRDNPEIQRAIEKNIPCMERSKFLAMIGAEYEKIIAIAGTHGKTTTTAMIAYICLIAGLNPTVHIGGEFGQIGGNIHIGSKKYFITEACEFRDSFLTLSPDISVVTNIEFEHMDYFRTFENELKSFRQFAKQTKRKCITTSEVLTDKTDKFITIGQGGFEARNIISQDGKCGFDCYKGDQFIGDFKLNIYGKHNINNALCAVAVCKELGVEYDAIRLGLKTFKNVHRRFEVVGAYKTNLVVHDYAHHPTEIKTSIETCKDAYNKKIICVFQPHTYSRTKSLIKEFLTCFDGIDELIVINTYPAREAYDYEGSAEFLKQEIERTDKNFIVSGVYTKKNVLSEIKKKNYKDCVILFLGAGDIENVVYKLK